MHLPPLRRQRRDLPRELGQGIDLALRPRARERGTVAELARALSVSLIQVGDAPGVVASPWPKSTRPLRSRDHAPDEARWRDRLSSDWTRDRDRDRPASEAEGRQPAPSDRMACAGCRGGRDRDLGRVAGVARPRPFDARPGRRGGRCRPGSRDAAPRGLGRARAARRRRPGGSGQGRRRLGAPVRGPVARDPAATQPDDMAAVGGRPGARRRSALPAPGRRSRRGPPAPGAGRCSGSPAGSGWWSPRRWRTPTSTRAGRLRRRRRRSGRRRCSRPSIASWGRLRAPNSCSAPWSGGSPPWCFHCSWRDADSPVALVLVTVWSAMVVSAIATFLGVNHSRGAGMPATAVLGAIVGAIVALAPAALRSWRSSHRAVSPA